MRFVHLHTHSHYSLLDGLAKIDDLVGRAKELGMDSLALTDHGNLYGAVEFYKKATKAGVKPILGLEAYVAPGSRHEKQTGKGNGNYHHLTLLVENEEGWKNLLKLSTLAHLEGFYYKPRVDKELLKENSKGLIALSGCLGGEIPQLILENRLEQAEKTAAEFLEIFGANNFFLELGYHAGIPESEKANQGLIEISKKFSIPIVATQDIHYARPEDSEYHDILLAVQTGNRIDDDDRLTLKNDDFSLRSGEQMAEYFNKYPEAIENTCKIADRCNLKIELGKIHLPKFPLPENETNVSYLERLISERMPEKYPDPSDEVLERVAYEMDVIGKTGFADYFLIVQDLVNWAKSRGIMVGPGRGSAAGSIVSYILNITDIDPLRYDLLFERFLNPDRIQMPDIDMDFADTRRDEVFGYVRQKYGEDKVAQIITFGTMAARAAIRDAGRAMGMSYGFCDQIAKLIPFQHDLKQSLAEVEEVKQIYQNDAEAKRLLDAASHLEGVARHASVHACGVVIAPEPLTRHIPLQRSPQSDEVIITQLEMGGIEDLGLLKMDFLGLKNLSIIEETVRLAKENKNEEVKIPKDELGDPKVYEILQAGDTTGVFQLESSGMRRYLKELKPSEFEDVIVMVALYRPGPMELIPSYIARKHGQEKVSYLHPSLEPILRNTYGIGVYQEQMMRIARDLGGFTLAEADTLRKAIGKKIKELLDKQQEKLIDGMIKKGIGVQTAKEIWELFPPFAKYGFNRSHAACYALIAYQTAYLKAHYPLEFMTALFNADSGDVERCAFLIGEAKKMGVSILPPDINKSFSRFTPEEKNIRFGLLAVKNVGANIAEAIIEERSRGGDFVDLPEFIRRVRHKDLNKKSLESLIKAGALDSLGIERGKLLFNIDEILKFSQNLKKSENGSQNNLFGQSFACSSLVLKEAEPVTKKEKLLWEKELLGLYVSGHPLEDYLMKFEQKNVRFVRELLANKKPDFRRKDRLGGVITAVKKILTKDGKPMMFAKVQDYEGEEIEMIVFTDAFSKKPEMWRESNILVAEGRMSWRNNEPKFICNEAVEV